jgi:UDPglucose 6-dehydrogenase
VIAVIGLGFVGLTTALGLADKTGHKVYGYDMDKAKRKQLQEGDIPFFEPYLQDKLRLQTGTKFFISEDLKETIERAQIIFYCIGTPSDGTGKTDLNPLISAVSDSLQYIDGSSYKTLVIKSTVPPTTTDRHMIDLIEKKGFTIGQQIGLANNPEFLREGMAWLDFVEPDRIIVGVSDPQSGQIMEQLYANFHVPIHKVTFINAEFIKYMSNSLLATMISFANEMSMIAGAVKDIDIKQAFQIVNSDKRWIGSPAPMAGYVYPGCGFGGYCLPKDIDSLIHTAEENGYAPTLLKEVVHVNAKVKRFIVDQVEQQVEKEGTLGILGLSFKPDSDDVRGAASKDIIEQLLAKGYDQIIAYDPKANHSFQASYSLPIAYAEQLQDVLEQCEAIVVLTAWDEFKELRSKAGNKKIIDGRYFLS